MRKFAWPLTLVVIALGVVAVLLLTGPKPPKPSSLLPVVNFYGLVIDEYGNPLPDASVLVYLDWTPPNYYGPSPDTNKRLDLTTDQQGRFEVRNERAKRLQVLDVKKPGHVWLVDYAWMAKPEYRPHDNRFYGFENDHPYLPDPAHPAVFPLMSTGSKATARTSRGGADREPDGTVVVNVPWTPLIPSAGPGSSETAIEVERRIVALVRSSTTAPSIRSK